MNLNLTMPVKASLGASAAAGTSLAAAGAGGAFSNGAKLEKVEGNKEDLVEEINTSEDENNDTKQPQTVIEDSQNLPTDVSEDKALAGDEKVTQLPLTDDLKEEIPGDNYDGLKTEDHKLIKFVSQDKTPKYEQGTIGYKYSRFLVSVEGSDEDGNEKWWNKQFINYGSVWVEGQVRSPNNPFSNKQKFTSGYDKNLSKSSLNGLCHEIYKLTKTDEEIKQQPSFEPSDDDVTTYSIWEDFWIFCSPEKIDPYYIEDSNSNHRKPKENEIAYQYKNKLLSTSKSTTIENEFIWKKLNYHFFKTEDVKDEYFKSFKDENLETFSANKENLLEKRCEEAYQIQTTASVGASRPSDETLLKYCSLGD